ncbi:MAG: hypothetical protein MK066_07020, partial [Crocinitomicaceae bacterium]|nr:hypothetical protein [Crocinitomicaceae bacterium]
MRFLLIFILMCFFGIQFGFSQEVKHHHSLQHAFIENKGQWGDNVLFQSKIEGGNLWVEQGRFLFQFHDYSEVAKYHTKEIVSPVNADVKRELIELIFWGA